MKSLDRYILYLVYFLIIICVSRDIIWLYFIPQEISKFMLISISVLYVFRNNVFVSYEKYLLLFVSVVFFYFFIHNNIGYTYISNTIMVLLIYFPMKHFSFNGYITDKNTNVFLVALFTVMVISFSQSRSLMVLDRGTENVTTNYGYFFATFLPFVFLIKQKYLQYIFVFLSLIATIYSAKRGANIIAFTISVIFLIRALRQFKKKTHFFLLPFFFIAVYFTCDFIYNIMNSSEAFINRYEQLLSGDDSGRADISNNILDTISIRPTFNLLLGNGYFSTVDYFGIEAHNDWLEVLFDCGLLGLLSYFMFVFKTLFYCKRIKSDYKLTWIIIIAIWIFKSVFSMAFYNSNSILLTISLGMLIGKILNKNENSVLN